MGRWRRRLLLLRVVAAVVMWRQRKLSENEQQFGWT
jgi:hypothetical protein